MLNSSTSDPSDDSQSELPELARGVLELFSGSMASISFPDVDGAVLQRQTELVLERRRTLEAAKAALEQATAELASGFEELLSLSDRGLAYARIYAAAHPEKPELTVELAQLEERIKSSRPLARDGGEGAAAGGKRGRKKAPRPELPFVEAGGEQDESAAASEKRTVAAGREGAADAPPAIEVVDAPAIEVIAEVPAPAAPSKRGRKKAAAAADSGVPASNGAHGETVIERD